MAYTYFTSKEKQQIAARYAELLAAGHLPEDALTQLTTEFHPGEPFTAREIRSFNRLLSGVECCSLPPETPHPLDAELLSRHNDNVAAANVRMRKDRRLLNAERNHLNRQVTIDVLQDRIMDAVRTVMAGRQPLPAEPLAPCAVAKPEDTSWLVVFADAHHDGDEKNLKLQMRALKSLCLEARQVYGARDIQILELGDSVEGTALHISQLLSAKEGLMEQALAYYHAFGETCGSIARHFDSTVVRMVSSSNHGQLRIHATQRDEFPLEDVAVLGCPYAEAIATSLSKKVKFHYDKDLLWTIQGKQIFAAHGHAMEGKHKEGMLEKIGASRNVMIDYGFFGHWHQYRLADIHSVGDKYDRTVIYAPKAKLTVGDYERQRELTSSPALLLVKFTKERGLEWAHKRYIL